MCRTGAAEGLVRRSRRRAVACVKPSEKPEPNGQTPEWVVVDFDGRGFRCERCGATEKHSTPRGVSRLESFVLRGRAFAMDHENCEEAPHA